MTLVEEAIDVCKIQTGVYIRDHHLPPLIQQEDLLQEVLVRMLRYISDYDPAKGQLKTFLQHHTFGAIQDYLRKCDGYKRRQGKTTLISLTVPEKYGASADKIGDIPDSRVNIGADCIASELPKFLEIVGKSIPPEYWQIVTLYYFEGKETAEIGKLLSLKDQRVAYVRRMALKKLLRVMQQKRITRMSQVT